MFELAVDHRKPVPMLLLIKWLRRLGVAGHREKRRGGFGARHALEIRGQSRHLGAGAVGELQPVPVPRPARLARILGHKHITAVVGSRGDLELEPCLHSGGQARVGFHAVLGHRPLLEEVVGYGATCPGGGTGGKSCDAELRCDCE